MDWTETWDKVTDTLNRGMEGLNRGLLVVFGNSNEREIRKLAPIIERINSLEERMKALTNEELKGLTQKFRERLAAGETLDDLLPEAFAACRESGRRYLNMRHFDVQLMGGAVLHSGKIAEMVTGEGKTLVATLPAYLNALEGKGVHVVTVNDYLARRDAEWMSPLYQGLGMTVGAIQSNMDSAQRQYHYSCDITYGTNNEFGFDYLRDNMKPTRELQCQKYLHYAIIDEVDSILIDEARTPLIISGPAFDDPKKYAQANRVAIQLQRDVHFEVKEKEHTCHLTDAGILEAEKLVGVESFYTAGNMEWPHLIDNALKAHYLYKRDRDYMVDNGQVIIIDEHTGRKMEGRQWSDGLHQAVEAKEGVKIKEETQTLATITFQNFFKLYNKLSGMTGTAMTEANEFYKIYKLDVVAVPTNKPLRRVNHPDVIFCTEQEKWRAVIDEVKTVMKTGRPILIGTASVEKSEYLSDLFKRHGIRHEVLNAKFIEREAEIVAQAGRTGAVTISTNMAGRGTDIILGGNPEAMAWATLKHKYASRLEVPPEEWRAAVEPFEEEMKQEGLRIKEEPSVEELAKIAKVKDPQKIAEVVNLATRRELSDPESLAKKHNVDAGELAKVIDLKRAAHPGGLHIIGTERHESRRIDNQLRGRAGRQGDPGSSRFYLSLEDDLMRIFAGDWVRSILQRLGMQEGEAIESRMVSKRIEAAQKKREEHNFEIRKNLLEYDEIMDTQRKRVYGYRQDILDGANCKELAMSMIDHQIDKAVARILQRDYGPTSFAVWVGNRLGIEFEAREFTRMEFEQAEATARDEARRQAESLIIDAVDENLSDEVEPREWNWEGLANLVNSRWGLQLNPHHLKRISRDELGVYLYDHVSKAIDKVHLEGGRHFFDNDFGIQSLVGWCNYKFDLGLKVEDLPSTSVDDADVIARWLKDKARETYERKEIEFPVTCGLNQFLPVKTDGSSARYDREGLIHWAQKRFHVDVDPEEFKNLSRHDTHAKLIEISKNYYKDGAIFKEIDSRLAAAYPKGATEVPNDQLTGLAAWAQENLELTLDLSQPLVERTQVERQLRAAAERRYRPELREVERNLLLQFLDIGWKDHLYAMDHLRSGIGLVSYAQIDPKVEYKRKGRQLFEEMWDAFENKVTDLIFRIEQADSGFVSSIWHITNAVHEQAARPTEPVSRDGGIREQQDAAIEMSKGDDKTEPIRNRGKKVGRNSPCPCGSGKKYKNCCAKKDGRLAG